jgi:hypothetical protein
MIFRDHESLMRAIKSDVDLTLIPVANKMKEVVQHYVGAVVYAPYDDMVRRYYRGHGLGNFYDSWDTVRTYDAQGNLVIKVFSNPEKMGLDYEMNIHGHGGDMYDEFSVDRRENLDKYIAEGTNYDFYVTQDMPNYMGDKDNWWTRPRDYFSPALQELDDGLFELEVSSELRKNGISFK